MLSLLFILINFAGIMKILSYIFAFYIMLLTVQPAVALLLKKETKDCCSECCNKCKDVPKQENQNKDNCPESACNPFQACGCCVGYTLSVNTLNFVSSFTQNTERVIFKENFISQFSVNIWQPPKIS
jgi:hypothetical protein